MLLSDSGLCVSHRSLSVYCQVHRLLLAVAEHWSLWQSISKRLDTFANSPASRVKKNTPNLGLLLPLLALGNRARHGWSVLGDAVLRESLSRKVLWMCKRDPSLVEVSVCGHLRGRGRSWGGGVSGDKGGGTTL